MCTDAHVHVQGGTARLAVISTLLLVTGSLAGVCTDAHVHMYTESTARLAMMSTLLLVTGSLTGVYTDAHVSMCKRAQHDWL